MTLQWESAGNDEPGDQNANTDLVGRGYWSLGPDHPAGWSVCLVEQDNDGQEIGTTTYGKNVATEAEAKALAQHAETARAWCAMTPDGVDTNGDKWNRCTVHDHLALGGAYVCEGYEPPPYKEKPMTDKTLVKLDTVEIAVPDETVLRQFLARHFAGEGDAEYVARWDPRGLDSEGEIFSLVDAVFQDADSPLTFPPQWNFAYHYSDDADGGSYTWLLDIPTSTDDLDWGRLAYRWEEQRKIGEPDLVGIDAAFAIIKEAVATANGMIRTLKMLVAAYR